MDDRERTLMHKRERVLLAWTICIIVLMAFVGICAVNMEAKAEYKYPVVLVCFTNKYSNGQWELKQLGPANCYELPRQKHRKADTATPEPTETGFIWPTDTPEPFTATIEPSATITGTLVPYP